MRLGEKQIRKRMFEIRQDSRFKAHPADMGINAPLAIVQTALNTELKTLYFCMNYDDDFVAGETCAETMIARYGLRSASTIYRPTIESQKASFVLGYMAVINDYKEFGDESST